MRYFFTIFFLSNRSVIIFRDFFQVDHTRVNEFGFSGEMLDEQSKKKSLDTDKKSLEDKKKD